MRVRCVGELWVACETGNEAVVGVQTVVPAGEVGESGGVVICGTSSDMWVIICISVGSMCGAALPALGGVFLS